MFIKCILLRLTQIGQGQEIYVLISSAGNSNAKSTLATCWKICPEWSWYWDCWLIWLRLYLEITEEERVRSCCGDRDWQKQGQQTKPTRDFLSLDEIKEKLGSIVKRVCVHIKFKRDVFSYVKWNYLSNYKHKKIGFQLNSGVVSIQSHC